MGSWDRIRNKSTVFRRLKIGTTFGDLTGISRSSFSYESRMTNRDAALEEELIRLSRKYPRWGYRKISVLLSDLGWHVNKKKVHRLWRKCRLQVHRKKRKKFSKGDESNSCHKRVAQKLNQVWSIDFVCDQTADGRKLKILTVLDEYSREALAVDVNRKMNSQSVESVLKDIINKRGCPEFIRSDNGSEFVAKNLRLALTSLGIENAYIAGGSPWQNGKNERLNGILRDELHNCEEFYSLMEARIMHNKWLLEYNTIRPHGAINNMCPDKFAMKARIEGCVYYNDGT